MVSTRELEALRADARYHGERYAIYRAKAYGQRPTSTARLEALERAATAAQERLAHAEREAATGKQRDAQGESGAAAGKERDGLAR
jgi:hypothetical protein